jgi:hypothetical protein
MHRDSQIGAKAALWYGSQDIDPNPPSGTKYGKE